MRKKVFEQLQSLAFQIEVQRGKTGDICVGTRQVRDDTNTHRLANGTHYDGDRFGRLLGCEVPLACPRSQSHQPGARPIP